MRALARRAHAFAAYDVPFDAWARRPHSTGRQDVICDAGAFAHHTLLNRTREERSEHALDIRGEGRKRADGVANVACGNAELHRKRKNVDQLFPGVAHNVGAKNAIGRFIDKDLGPSVCLIIGPGESQSLMSLA